MKPELSIIKAFLSYETWNKYSSYISSKDFPEELAFLYRVLDTFHQTNEQQADLHLLDLANLFFSQTKKDKEFYEGVFDTLEAYSPNEETVKQLCVSLKRSKLLREASIMAYEVAEGKKDFEAFQSLLGGFTEQTITEEDEENEAVSDDICELVAKTYSNPGLKFRLLTLRQMFGSLRKGNFGFIFARPETGKTTFLASEITYMAEQLKEGDGPILWLNNEQVHEEVKMRIVQAALGITLEQLLSNKNKWNEEYKKKFGGKILVIHTWTSTKRDTERLCKKYKPSLVVVDQVDKITGFQADREDLVLGAVYQWARELAKQYCPFIAVCQADGTAEGQRWLNMGHVANAKTAKQAEADWILAIGKIHESGWENVRFLSVCKNKLLGDEESIAAMRHGRREVLIKPDEARYEDIA